MNEKAREILIRARKDVFSGSLGSYPTVLKGDGLDFREIRDYEYGDDIRKLNWKATARSNRLKTNVFNEERELNIVLVFMLSGSMHFGSARLKQETAAEILALLAFSSLKNDNRLQSVFFDNKTEKFFEPTRHEAVVYEMVESAVDIKCLGREADYSSFCTFVNSVVRQKSLIFIIGDFYGDVDLSTISHKNELYAIVVRDRIEEYPDLGGDFELVDPVSLTGGEITMSREIAREYRKKVEEHDTKLAEHFLEHGVAYGKVYTDEDVFIRLSEIIKG